MKQSSSSSLATKIKPIFVLEHYLGIESGFIYDHESNTMAIICLKQTILFSFETREILLQWQTKLREHFCKGKLFFLVFGNIGKLFFILIFTIFFRTKILCKFSHSQTTKKERHFLVQVVNVPNNNGHSTNTTNNNQNQNKQIKLGSARLLLQDSKFCLVNNIPPTLLCYWSIKQLRRFGLIDNKFCFEGGSQCGKGLFVSLLLIIFSM